ncbi:MAG: hypothetical protein ACOWWR_15665 [Eubacteriales bacterium]
MKELIIVLVIVGFGYFIVKRAANIFYYHDELKKYYDQKYNYDSIDEEETKK